MSAISIMIVSSDNRVTTGAEQNGDVLFWCLALSIAQLPVGTGTLGQGWTILSEQGK